VTLYFYLPGLRSQLRHSIAVRSFSGFPKPLLVLLGRFVASRPRSAPEGLAGRTELIRESLGKIERRRRTVGSLRYPLRTAVRGREKLGRGAWCEPRQSWVSCCCWQRHCAVVFPDSISKLVRGSQKPKQLAFSWCAGLFPAANSPRAVAKLPSNTSSTPPAVVSSQPVNAAALPETPAPAKNAASTRSVSVPPADVQQAQIASAQPQGRASTKCSGNAAAATPDTSVLRTRTQIISSGKTPTAAASASHSTAQSKRNLCLNSQTRSLQPKFSLIFPREPHWFGAQSRHGYHIRWAFDFCVCHSGALQSSRRMTKNPCPSSNRGYIDATRCLVLARIWPDNFPDD